MYTLNNPLFVEFIQPGGGNLFQRFCKVFSESSPRGWDVLQLPCCPGKKKELSENMLQNLRNMLLSQTVFFRCGHCEPSNKRR